MLTLLTDTAAMDKWTDWGVPGSTIAEPKQTQTVGWLLLYEIQMQQVRLRHLLQYRTFNTWRVHELVYLVSEDSKDEFDRVHSTSSKPAGRLGKTQETLDKRGHEQKKSENVNSRKISCSESTRYLVVRSVTICIKPTFSLQIPRQTADSSSRAHRSPER